MEAPPIPGAPHPLLPDQHPGLQRQLKQDFFVAKHMKIATYMINSDACRKIEDCPNLFFSFEIHKLK